MNLRRRLLLIPLALLFVATLLVLGLTAWLLLTDPGLKRVAGWVTELQPSLQLQQPQGRLLGNMQFAAIRWQQPGIELEITEVNTRLEPGCLLALSVCLEQLQVATVTLDLLPDPDQPVVSGPVQLVEVPLPFDLTIARPSLGKLQINSDRQPLFEAHDIALRRLLWRDTTLSFKGLQLTTFDETISGAGKIKLQQDYPLQAKLKALPQAIPDLSAYLQNTKPGPLTVGAKLRGTLRQLQADVVTGGPLQLKGQIALAPLDEGLPFSATLRSQAAVSVSMADSAVLLNASQLDIEGNLEALRFSLASELKLPLPDQPLAAASPATLPATLSAKGTTDYDAVTFDSLSLITAQGQVMASGQLNTREGANSDFALAVTDLNPGLLNPLYPGKLSFEASVAISNLDQPVITGSLSGLAGEWLEVPLSSTGSVSWTRGQRLHFERFQLRSNDDRLSMNGDFPDQSLQLRLAVAELALYSPQVSGSLTANATLSGSLEKPALKAQLSGRDLHYADYRAQSLSSNISIREFGWQQSLLNVQLDGLLLPGQEDPLAATLELRATQQGAATALAAGSLLIGERLSTGLQLKLHQLPHWRAQLQCASTLTLEGMALDSRCDNATIKVNEQLWALADDAVPVDAPQVLAGPDAAEQQSAAPITWSRWRNQQPLLVRWQAEPAQLGVDAFCFRNQASAICLEEALQWQTGQQQATRVTARRLPLAWLQAFTEDAYRVQGEWGFTASLQQATASDSWQLQGELAAEQAVLVPVQIDASRFSLPIEEIGLNFSANTAGFEADYSLQSSVLGSVQGELAYLSANKVGQDEKFTGKLHIEQLDLEPLQELFPEIRRLSGYVSADLRFIYQHSDLQLFGDSRLAELNISSRVLPFELANASAKVDFNDNRLQLAANGTIGDGQAKLTGNASWSAEDWRAELALETTAIRIEPLPRSYANIESAITLLATPGELEIGGEITIPEARLVIEELPQNAVGVSDDTIIEEEGLRDSAVKVSANINTVLGDDVKFSGFGLQTSLQGQLRIKQIPGRLTNGNGVVRLVDGRYRAYGQDLTIEEGRMIFAGPLSNPQILVTAVRRNTEDDVRVGVQVTGTARDPELDLFSSPAMSEQDRLYYLLTGRGPNSVGGDDSRLAQQTAIALGLAQSNKSAREIGESVGVKDLQVGTDVGRNGEEAQVSGFITSEIYLIYGVSIFDQMSSITARYALTRSVYVEVYDSVSSAIDVFWAIGGDRKN